jgi:hypothetical protein
MTGRIIAPFINVKLPRAGLHRTGNRAVTVHPQANAATSGLNMRPLGFGPTWRTFRQPPCRRALAVWVRSVCAGTVTGSNADALPTPRFRANVRP